METRTYQVNGVMKFGVEMTPSELSDLKDEICEAIVDSKSATIRNTNGTMDAIFGTLANWGICIE